MNFLADLKAASTNRNELASYLKKNIDLVYDFFLSQSYSDISVYKEDIENYILSKFKIIKSLDLDVKSNSAFLLILLEISERLGFQLFFQRIYRLLNAAKIDISQRLQAVALYTNGMRSLSDFEEVIVKILTQLEDAYQHEEDEIDQIISTVVNIYAHIVESFGEFNLSGVKGIRNQLIESKQNHYILKHNLIEDIFNVDISNSQAATIEIYRLLDTYLKRAGFEYPKTINYQIEEETSYALEILNMESSLEDILNINKIRYSKIQDDDYYYALGRGVNILDKEEYMLAYMYAFGNMHIAKLERAIDKLPTDIDNVEIIDWGCGQGLGSLVFLNKYSAEKIKSVFLIEPSTLCLKRAALHVHQQFSNLNTINKDLDSLTVEDFQTLRSESCFVHLFSNILDVERFSLNHLINLIKTRFKGRNYFVITSPRITSLKTARIDSFVEAFEHEFEVEMFYQSEKLRGEWLNNWTKVIRVLKVDIV